MSALKYIRPSSLHWRPEVKLCSSLEGDGVGKVWEVMAEFRGKMEESGELEARRRRQHLRWMWSYVEERLVRMARDIGHHHNIENLENMVSHAGLQGKHDSLNWKSKQTVDEITNLMSRTVPRSCYASSRMP